MRQIDIATIEDRFALIELCESYGYVLYVPFDTCRPCVLHEELSQMTGIGSEHYHQLAYRVLPHDIDALCLKDTVASWDFSRIIDGTRITWDGNNQVGHLTADAEDAVEEFFFAVNECATVEVINYDLDSSMDLEDAELLGLTAASTDSEIEKIATRHYAESAARGAFMGGGVIGQLERLREELIQRHREEEAEDA